MNNRIKLIVTPDHHDSVVVQFLKETLRQQAELAEAFEQSLLRIYTSASSLEDARDIASEALGEEAHHD